MPAQTSYFANWIANSWARSTNGPDLDNDTLKMAFYLGGNMSGTWDYSTDLGYGNTPWNTIGEVTGGAGAGGWGYGGYVVSPSSAPTARVQVSAGPPMSVGLLIPKITLNSSGAVSASNFDTLLLYGVNAGGNYGITSYVLGSPYSISGSTLLYIDFNDYPQPDSAFYGT